MPKISENILSGIVETEALRNPLLINEFEIIKLNVEYHPESSTSRYWHVCNVKIPKAQADILLKKIAQQMKPCWFSLFWNEKEVKVIFSKKIFTLIRKDNKNYQDLEKYALAHGIQKKYLSEIKDLLR